MKITGFEGFLARVGNRPRVLVRVDTDEGISGWGEAYNHGPDEALFPVFEYMFAQIVGEDPRRIEHLTQ
jgi:galactonate dehydratase